MTQFQQNFALSVLLIGAALYMANKGRGEVALACVGIVAALWRHSGRDKSDGPPLPVSVFCLAFLALGACRNPPGDLTIGIGYRAPVQAFASPSYGTNALLLADGLEMKPLGSAPTVTSGRAALYSLSSDGLLYTQDGNGLALKLHAAQSFRPSANCAGLSSPAAGDVCFDSGLGLPRFYSGGWSSFPSDALVVHLAGSETVSGAKTFTAAQVFNGAVTLGDAAADAVAVKGALAIDNAANTYAVALTSTITANRAITFPDAAGALVLATNTATLTNKTLTAPVINGASSASGNFDLSGSSGTTKTTTGAVTIGPGAVGVSGDVTLTTTKTLSAGSNTLIGAVADKLNAAMLAIASQAVGDLLYADSTTTFARLAAGTSGYPLLSGGAGMAPAWAQIGSTGISAGTIVYGTVSGGAKGSLGAATGYLGGAGVALTTTVEVMSAVGTRTGTARTLYCLVGTAPGGADTVVFTARKSSTDQTLTCTITGAATTCNDTTHTFAVAAGNPLSIKAASSAGTASDANCSFEVTN